MVAYIMLKMYVKGGQGREIVRGNRILYAAVYMVLRMSEHLIRNRLLAGIP